MYFSNRGGVSGVEREPSGVSGTAQKAGTEHAAVITI